MPVFKLNPPSANLPPGSTVLAYLRDSGHETQELSIAQQRRSLDEWAIQHGLVITRYYIDEARRGATTAGRDQLHLLMFALRHAAPERAVIVWSYNRFSRGLDEPALYRAEIRTLGYQFHSLTDDVPEGPIGRIVEAVIDYKNYQYLVDLSIDIQRGQRDLVRTHGCVPGTPPRGFKRVPVTLGQRRDGSPHTAHRWAPDPDTAPLVLLAFQMRAAGASLSSINNATHLYSSINSYVSFWSNKLYIGTLQFGDLTIENYCDPIVPLDIWQIVQDKQRHYRMRQHMSSDQDHPRRTASRYLLSGLLRCSQCDAPINGNSSTFRGQHATDTYACANVRKHLCNARRIPRELLEKTIIDTVSTYILDPDVSLARQDLDASNYSTQQAEINDQRAAKRKQLTQTRKSLNRITEAIKAHGHSERLLAELTDLEKTETSLLNQIAQTGEPAPLVIQDRQQLANQAAITIKKLHDGTLEEKRAILHGIIQSIKVQNVDKHIKGIVFFYSPIRISQTDHDPPAVSITPFPPGAPRFIHSIVFDTIYKHKRITR